jgi:hypothetical protein
VSASHHVHPEFGFLCPTPRFRRRVRLVLAGLVVAGLGAGVMAATGGSKRDAASVAETVPVAIPAPSANVGARALVVTGSQTAADKPACVGDTSSDACLSVKPRKPRMVRVATDRPAIAAVALGRSAPPALGMLDAPPPPSDTPPGAMARASEAEVAAATAIGPEKPIATPKKAKKSANRQNRRRDPYWYGAPSWREVEYQRGGYGRGGFTPNFW